MTAPRASTATCWISSGSRSLREALAEARRFLAQPAVPAQGRPDTYDRTEAARNLWDRCGPIDGSHAETYLRARGIHRCRFPALRFHNSLPFRTGAGGWRRYPALVAAVTGGDRALEGVHRTWLDPRRAALACVSRPRKALGRIHGLAVRFGEPHGAATLLVGEGIETVLSLVTAWPDTILPNAVLPHAVAAAALSAGSLGAFMPPKHVTRLIVAQDRDEAGARASRRLQLRCTRLGATPRSCAPESDEARECREAARAKFNAGDAVSFIARGERHTGPIVRMNPKRARVKCGDVLWSVPYARLDPRPPNGF